MSADTTFSSWLHSTSAEFLRLSDNDRIITLDYLIGLCGSKELDHLYNVLPMLLYRDFLRLLPEEIALKILLQLDEQSILNCCLVSKHWNNLLHRFHEIWRKLAQNVGANIPPSPSNSVTFYKSAFLKMRPFFGQMENKSAFDILTLEGHTGRVMAVASNEDVIVTGSDDHSLRVWDIYTGICVNIFRAQSVAALHLEGDKVYAGSYDASATCWHLDSDNIVQRYVGHTSAVFSLHSNSDLNLLITGSADKSVKLWEAISGKLLFSFHDHEDWVMSVRIITLGSVLNPDLDNSTLHFVTSDKKGYKFWSLENLHYIYDNVNFYVDFCKCVPFDTQGASFYAWQPCSHTLTTFMYEEIVIIDNIYDEHEIAMHVELPETLPPKQTVLGMGEKFAVFMVDREDSRIVIVDLIASEIVCSIPVPPYRQSQNGATVTLGSHDWLNGFTNSNRHGLFLATSLIDNTVLVLKWKDR